MYEPRNRPPPINPIDQHVGRRLRALRRARGLSMHALAEALGVSFQQVQKYEQGRNRLSASRLFEAVVVLQAAPAELFEGLALTSSPTADPLARFASMPEGPFIAATFPKIENGEARQVVVQLIRLLATEG